MDIAFFMGMVLGFLLGIFFTVYMTGIVTGKIVKVLDTAFGGKIKDNLNTTDEDDPVNYWKPKGWKPDSSDEMQ